MAKKPEPIPKSSMKKLTYREGDLFVLPLQDLGYAVGLVARSGPRGRVLFGYFFGPRYPEMPKLSELVPSGKRSKRADSAGES
jgi:hypothetical protein